MKNIVYIAKDFAPSVALRAVANECAVQGYTHQDYFGGDFSKANILSSLKSADMLISGMGHSAEAADLELYAITSANALGLPIVLYSDTWDCYAREWFSSIRKLVSLLFVVSESERVDAEPLFPNARIIVSGNPLWESASFPSMTRENVRKKYNLDDETLAIFLTCGKEMHINLPHIHAVIDAITKNTSKTYPLMVFASIHPGASNKEQYTEIFSRYSFIEEITGKIVDILPGMDVVVNAGSGAGIEAVHQRIPVIEFTIPAVLDEVERLHGTRVWQLVADGVALPAHDALEIAKLLDMAREHGNVINAMAIHATEKYPLPKSRDAAVTLMVSEISKMS